MKEKKKSKPALNHGLVYCGPTIVNVVRQFTPFTNGLSPELVTIVKKYPLLEHLIVPVSELAATKTALKVSSSPTSLIYSKAEQLLKGGK